MKKLLASAVLLAWFGSAQAQLSYTGGTAVTFAGYSDSLVLGTGPVTQGIENVLLDAGAGGTLTVTFLGKEALDSDNFTFTLANLAPLTVSNSAVAPSSVGGVIAPGPLTFTFSDVSVGNVVGNGGLLTNGFASYALLGSGSGASFVPNTAGGQFTYVLGFNDGLRVDADYDDLVIGIALTPAIPEPETYALMLAGLGAVGFIARRRRQA